jgi:DNA-binding transcriptional LysR family regulator
MRILAAADRLCRCSGWDTAAVRYTLRQLEYFVATCDAGSVTDAALNIPVAQSSVSSAIAQLEAALRVQLLIRHHAQGVSPTPAGRQFLDRARALLRDAEELERLASELTEELTGELDLGCIVPLAPLATPQLCQSFHRENPGVSVEMVEADQADIVARLRTGALAMAVTYDLELTDDLRFERLAELPPYAVFAVDHPLATRDSVTLAELASEPFVLLDLPLSRDYFRTLFATAGTVPVVRHRSLHPEVIRTLVANGFGYTIVNAVPAIDYALDGRGVSTVAIAGDPRPVVVGLATLAAMRPTRLTAAFAEHCRRAVAAGAIPAFDRAGRARHDAGE